MIRVTFDARALARQMAVRAAVISEVVASELYVAATTAQAQIKELWPKRTGLSARSFRVYRTKAGAILRNHVPYVPHVHRAGVSALALDELAAPAIERAILEVPARAAASARRRLA